MSKCVCVCVCVCVHIGLYLFMYMHMCIYVRDASGAGAYMCVYMLGMHQGPSSQTFGFRDPSDRILGNCNRNPTETWDARLQRTHSVVREHIVW